MGGLQEEKGIAAFLSRAVTVRHFGSEISARGHAHAHAGDGMSEFRGILRAANLLVRLPKRRK